jgi:hypothetical protein
MLGYGLLLLLLLFTPSDGSVLAVSTKLMLVLLLEWWLRGQRVPPGRLSLDEAVVHLFLLFHRQTGIAWVSVERNFNN